MYTNYGEKTQQINSEIFALLEQIRKLYTERGKANKRAVAILVEQIRNATDNRNGSTAREIYDNLPKSADISFQSLVNLLTWADGNQTNGRPANTTIPFKSVRNNVREVKYGVFHIDDDGCAITSQPCRIITETQNTYKFV